MKRKRLQLKLATLFLGFAVALSLVLSTFSYVTAKTNYTAFYTEKIQEITRYAATLVDGDAISAYLDTMRADAYYDQLQDSFNALKKEHGLMYLFVFRPNESDFSLRAAAAAAGRRARFCRASATLPVGFPGFMAQSHRRRGHQTV